MTSVQVFKEEQYLMASDMAGKVGNTDLRPREQGAGHDTQVYQDTRVEAILGALLLLDMFNLA